MILVLIIGGGLGVRCEVSQNNAKLPIPSRSHAASDDLGDRLLSRSALRVEEDCGLARPVALADQWAGVLIYTLAMVANGRSSEFAATFTIKVVCSHNWCQECHPVLNHALDRRAGG